MTQVITESGGSVYLSKSNSLSSLQHSGRACLIKSERDYSETAMLQQHRITQLSFVLGLVAWLVHQNSYADEGTRDAVVKIFSSNRSINLSLPWDRQTPRSVSGSGVVIGKGRVLTNAHVVLNTTDVSIQPANSSERIPAKVKILAAGIDLALLEFKPVGTIADVKPLELAKKSPAVRSTIRVFGYPTGGDAQSVTEGMISRIEHTSYRYGTYGMRMQIDAAINSGNSGGPAIVDGKIAGLAFSVRRDANDIGYVIPTEEIQRFLEDIKDGSYEGKPRFIASYQYLENRALRRKLAISANVTGVLYRAQGKKDGVLKDGDVITQMGKYNVDNRGRCRLENGLNLTLTRLAVEIAKEGQVSVTVVRDSKTMKLDVPVESRKRLISYSSGTYPKYFIYGPIVFSKATANYMTAIDSGAASADATQRRAMSLVKSLMFGGKSPLLTRRLDYREDESGEELIVVTRILTHATARGYRQVPYFLSVKSINGTKVKNFAQLVTLLRDAKDEFIEVKFFDTFAESLVFDRKQVVDSIDSILEDNNIARQGSAELMKIWREKP
jgi:S1-C subfamily serine protease